MSGLLSRGTTWWVTGLAHGIADLDLVAIVGSEVPLQRLRDWWDQGRSVTGLVSLLDGIPGAPAAIALSLDDTVELRLRAAGANWTATDAEQSAAGTADWVERSIPGCRRLRLSVDTGPDRTETSAGLPTLGGLLPASSIGWALAPADPEPEPVPELGGGEFEDLWGEYTVMRPAEDAAVRPRVGERDAPPGPTSGTERAEPAPVEPAPVEHETPAEEPSSIADATWHTTESVESTTPQDDGQTDDGSDHDGQTRRQAWSGSQVPERETVLATLCAHGHANPPSRPTCRMCSEPLTGPARQVPRPDLGRMITSAGDSVPLDGTILVGRNPRPTVTTSGRMPRCVILPQPHVSARHLELRVEGWNVLARDVGSTNGTFLRRHGQPPVRMPETLQLVVTGDVIDLGHGVHLRFEDLP